MGIPGAFASYGAAGDVARGVANKIFDVPDQVKSAVQGTGITASQLAAKIAGRQSEYAPELESATRGLETSQAGLSNLLADFQSRTQATFAPYEIEAGLLGENMAKEFDLYKSQIKNALDRELAIISEQGLMDRAQLDRATKLAELEQTANQIQFQDLGDRIGIYDMNGNLLRTDAKGKLGGGGGGGSEDWWRYLQPQQTPSNGIGTIQGNWYYSDKGWMPIQ